MDSTNRLSLSMRKLKRQQRSPQQSQLFPMLHPRRSLKPLKPKKWKNNLLLSNPNPSCRNLNEISRGIHDLFKSLPCSSTRRRLHPRLEPKASPTSPRADVAPYLGKTRFTATHKREQPSEEQQTAQQSVQQHFSDFRLKTKLLLTQLERRVLGPSQ